MLIQYLDFPWLHPLSQTLPAWHSFNFKKKIYIYIWLTKSPTTYNNGFPLLFPPTIAARSAKQAHGSKNKPVSKTISFPVKTIPLGPAQTHAGPHFFLTRSKNRTCTSATIFLAPGPKKNTARSNKSCTSQKTCAKVQKPSSPKQFSNVGTSLDSLLLVCRVYAKIVQPEL